jgi:hypothetical protein
VGYGLIIDSQTYRLHSVAKADQKWGTDAARTCSVVQFFSAQSDKPNQITGTWINQDPSTMGITHILIEGHGGNVVARVWGACVPTDCNWVMTPLHFTNGLATGVFDMGFAAERMYFVRLPNDKLLAVYV